MALSCPCPAIPDKAMRCPAAIVGLPILLLLALTTSEWAAVYLTVHCRTKPYTSHFRCFRERCNGQFLGVHPVRAAELAVLKQQWHNVLAHAFQHFRVSD